MKTKFFTGMALAIALLVGQPAFAHSDRGKGGHSHSVAAVHRGGGGGHKMVAVRGGSSHAFRATRVASGRTFTATRSVASSGKSGRALRTSPSMAFGGSSRYGHGGGNPTYAFASHSGWSHGQEYSWRGHHYRWINNGWFIFDSFPGVAYYPYNGYGPDSDNTAVQVQQDLAHDGYYQGPIDGAVGPGTRAAIAAYQRDNGLPPTGAIDSNLLNSLNGG